MNTEEAWHYIEGWVFAGWSEFLGAQHEHDKQHALFEEAKQALTLPDTTLQDIADAWNEFKITENEYAYRGRSISFDQLAAKLDALVNE